MKIEPQKNTKQQRLWTKETQRRFMLLLLFFYAPKLDTNANVCVCARVERSATQAKHSERAKRNYSKLNNDAKTART